MAAILLFDRVRIREIEEKIRKYGLFAGISTPSTAISPGLPASARVSSDGKGPTVPVTAPFAYVPTA